MLEPSLGPKHENPPLGKSDEIHKTYYDTFEAQPKDVCVYGREIFYVHTCLCSTNLHVGECTIVS